MKTPIKPQYRDPCTIRVKMGVLVVRSLNPKPSSLGLTACRVRKDGWGTTGLHADLADRSVPEQYRITLEAGPYV